MAPINYSNESDSDSTGGARKALSVAIGYSDLARLWPKESPPLRLPYTHKDPCALKTLLVDKYGYKADDVKVLMDDGHHEEPTMKAMLKALEGLVGGAKAGDRFVFHFSGHGSQVVNTDGSEVDGMDEVIWPADVIYDSEAAENEKVLNFIIDDKLKEILVDRLPPDTHLTVLLDCCHSGTGLDLLFYHSDNSHDELWNLSPVDSPGSIGIQSPSGYFPSGTRGMSIDTITERSRTLSASQTKRNVKGITKSMKMPFSARGHTVSSGREDEKRETNIENKVENRASLVYQKHATSWSACLDEQIVEGDIAHKKHADVRQSANDELFVKAREAKRYWRGEKGIEFQELARTFPLPKPSLGSLVPTENILDTPFTF
ncbi:hypothetical protein EW145_g182 [Phellinidium pouzarii]|uniref:Peptidase C14 caspase domain-containing protein n=1 Tax=Phellinidium pouzarii TaxID=167371 RepID=A0A4S4LJB1_9AGAM|nr:hypothetical protein EW145_g182 [Phellinidium pouzarii]